MHGPWSPCLSPLPSGLSDGTIFLPSAREATDLRHDPALHGKVPRLLVVHVSESVKNGRAEPEGLV